jgi:hypothetical protein
MWLFAKDGFLSIVQDKSHHDLLLVRGRVQGDVQRFFPAAKVFHTARRDYAHRAIVPRESVAARLAQSIMAIDYGGGGGAVSFKDSITDKRRAPYYLDVWSTMAEMQDHLNV